MSVLLNDVTPDYLENAAAVGVSFPFAMSLWIYVDDLSIDQVLMVLANSTSEDNYHALMMIGTGSNQIRARTRDNLSANGDADTTAGISVNTWHHVLGIWNSASDRRVWLDGANNGTDATALGSVVGLDRTALGRLQKLTPTLPTSGRVAEAAIWNLSTLFTAAEIAQLAAGFSPLLTRLDEMLFYVPAYNVTPSLINDLVGGFHLTKNGTPATADHPIIHQPEGQWARPYKQGVLGPFAVSQAIGFGQAAAVPEFAASASNAIAFGQSVVVNVEYNRSITQNILFGQTAYHNIRELLIEQNIDFDQVVQANYELTIEIEQRILFEDDARRTFEESISQNIPFGQEASRMEAVQQTIPFGQSVVLDQSIAAQNDIEFGQSVEVNYELTVAAQNNIQFGQSVSIVVVRACTIGGLPLGTSILLTAAGATPLALRNPDFGNGEEVNSRRILLRSRGGALSPFKDAAWPSDTQITFTVKGLKDTDKAAILTFVLESLGKLVTYNDQDNRVWQGIIEQPGDVTVQEVLKDVYEAEFNLSAVLT